MTEALGPNQHLYQSAAMIVNFFVAVPALMQHYVVGAIEWSVVMRLLPLAAVAVVAGVGLSELPYFSGTGEAYLRGLFGVFLLVLSMRELASGRRGGEAETAWPTAGEAKRAGAEGEPRRAWPPRWLPAAAVAVPSGLISGWLGVGGGLIAVPIQRRWLGVPIRSAIAHSTAVVVATSAIGGLAKNLAYYSDTQSLQSMVLAAVLIPSAIVGSMVGSRWVHRLPVIALRLGFFIMLLVASGRMIRSVGKTIGAW